jgi:hypothetical protein
MLTGMKPFEFLKEFSPLQIAFKVAAEKTTPKIPAKIPQKFQTLLTQCWEHDPEKRFSVAEALQYVSEISANDFKCSENK